MQPPTTNDTLKIEHFHSAILKRDAVEWNYRGEDGELYCGVASSVPAVVTAAHKVGFASNRSQVIAPLK